MDRQTGGWMDKILKITFPFIYLHIHVSMVCMCVMGPPLVMCARLEAN